MIARARRDDPAPPLGIAEGEEDIGGADVIERDGLAQEASAGTSWLGVMKPTGMSGVECAQPSRPLQSTQMSPPLPRPSSTSTSTATWQACIGSAASLRMSTVRRASTTRMVASPSPVHDTPPEVLSA